MSDPKDSNDDVTGLLLKELDALLERDPRYRLVYYRELFRKEGEWVRRGLALARELQDEEKEAERKAAMVLKEFSPPPLALDHAIVHELRVERAAYRAALINIARRGGADAGAAAEILKSFGWTG